MKLLLLAGLACAGVSAHAGSLRFCDNAPEPNAAQQDRLIRFAALVKQELEASGQDLALVSRSGLNLARFGQRYSHAGISLKASANTPWSVRQLYYACAEGKPRIFDQGMSGFVMGLSDEDEGYVSIVTLPGDAGRTLEQAALDDHRAVQLLGATYSANAYAFADTYQNCNQWVAEMLALAWSGATARPEAQAWLQASAYAPTTIEAGGWALLGAFVPWVHGDDHPAEDRAAGRYRVSMPESLERFARAQVSGATRVELCRKGSRVVIHRGWEPVAAGCVPGDGDSLLALD